MKTLIRTIFFFAILFSANALFAQKEEVCYNPNLVKDTTKKSIKSVANGKIDGASFTINYHSPGVRKRIIWGGLVPYDEVWVTGAHDATTISIDKDVLINNVKVPAGKYAFFTIPGSNEWTVIINKHWKQHLASEYDEKDDIVRIKVKPQSINHLERLQYFIEPGTNNKGTISVAWEKIKISFPVTVLKSA
jgi:hypothetical protein